MTPDGRARSRLLALGRRRRRHQREGKRLARETSKAIVEEADKLSLTEAARLAGIHRSTAYEYLKAAD